MDDRPSPLLNRSIGITMMVISAMPLLGMRAAAVVIVAWIGLLFTGAILHRTPVRISWRPCLFLSAPFLLILLDLLRAEPFADAWRLAERSASLLVFPLGFLILGAPTRYGPMRFTDLFSLSAATLGILANILIFPHLLAASEVDIPFQHAYRSRFTEVTGIHPPYAAYWFFAAALFQLHALLAPRKEEGSLFHGVRMLLLVGCIAAGLLIGSRMPVIAFSLAAILLGALLLPRKRAILLGILVPCIVALAAWLSPSLRERTMELVGIGTDHRTGEQTSISIRTPIIHCSFTLLEEHWLVGTGQADVQPALDLCYAEVGHGPMMKQGYGPHCQPLQWWLAFGLPGLAAFVLLFGWSMREALRNKDHMHLSFLVFMLLCGFTEDLLTRQWGVVFFAFFNTLFMALARTTAPAHDR